MPQESRYIKATQCKEVDHFPIWLMRQAGRYMKIYRDLREKHTMMEALTTPELACEITMQPVKAFGVDAAIIFSDILILPHGLNLGLDFVEGSGPTIAKPINTQADVDNLDVSLIPGNVEYLMEAIRLTKKELAATKTPLIGFAGSPFTVASYIVGEGKKHDFNKFFQIAFSNLPMIHSLLDKLTEATILYLNAQIKAGVDSIQIFDSWSVALSKFFFQELSAQYIKRVIQGLDNPRKIPITVYGTNYATYYPLVENIGANVISIDSHVDILDARKAVPSHLALQGNLDPYILLGSKDLVKQETLRILDSMKGQKGFIFNLGHGIIHTVPEENVKCVIDLVKNYQAK
jgi:uroporphyrinogen decarboxylase